MTEPLAHAAAPLRLVDDDGVPHEIERLRRENVSLKRMMQAAFEEKTVLEDTVKKYYREVQSVRAQLHRQEREDAELPIVQAVFGFWAALKGTNGLKLGPKRTKVILERVKDEPTTQPKEFLWPIMGIVLDPVPKENGTGAHDSLEIALRDDGQFYKYGRRGREYVEAEGKSPYDVIRDRGGEPAIAALNVLLDLQKEWEEAQTEKTNGASRNGKKPASGQVDTA